jgi:hypothetical protein
MGGFGGRAVCFLVREFLAGFFVTSLSFVSDIFSSSTGAKDSSSHSAVRLRKRDLIAVGGVGAIEDIAGEFSNAFPRIEVGIKVRLDLRRLEAPGVESPDVTDFEERVVVRRDASVLISTFEASSSGEPLLFFFVLSSCEAAFSRDERREERTSVSLLGECRAGEFLLRVERRIEGPGELRLDLVDLVGPGVRIICEFLLSCSSASDSIFVTSALAASVSSSRIVSCKGV